MIKFLRGYKNTHYGIWHNHLFSGNGNFYPIYFIMGLNPYGSYRSFAEDVQAAQAGNLITLDVFFDGGHEREGLTEMGSSFYEPTAFSLIAASILCFTISAMAGVFMEEYSS